VSLIPISEKRRIARLNFGQGISRSRTPFNFTLNQGLKVF
jgi:hypothetical protein